MASYPGSIPSLGTYTGADHPQVSHFNTPNDEIKAICTELGIDLLEIDDGATLTPTPSSVAQALGILARQFKGFGGGLNWYEAAVPARIPIGGHGNGSTVAAGVTTFAVLLGRNLGSEASAEMLIPFACTVVTGSFFIELLTAQGSGTTDTLTITMRQNGADLATFFIVEPSTPAGVYHIGASAVHYLFAAGDRLSVELSQDATAGAASAQIGAFGFEIRQVG